MKSKDTKRFTEYYQKQSVTSSYDIQREGTAYRRLKRRIELKYFLELLDKNKNEKVLEIGCSSGFLTQNLGKVTAIDTSEQMLEIAGGKNPKAKCICADMFELPFKDNSFDKIVSMRVWNHLNKEDLARAIRESKRVLKKGGFLIFDAEEKNLLRKFVGFFYKKTFRITGYKVYQYFLRQLYQILLREGFEIEKFKFFNHRVGRQIILRAKLKSK